MAGFEVGMILVGINGGHERVEYLGESQLNEDCFIGRDLETGKITDDWVVDQFQEEDANE